MKLPPFLTANNGYTFWQVVIKKGGLPSNACNLIFYYEMEDGMDYKTSLRAKSIVDVSKRKIVNNSQLRIIKYKRHDKRD